LPSIEIDVDELNVILGKEFEIEELIECIGQIGLDVEGHINKIIKAEYNPNRPDYSTIEGIARQLKGYLNIEKGLAEFKLIEGNITLNVEKSIEEVRPYIVCGVVRGLNFDSTKIQRLMNIQEDLHWLVGRNRLKAAIGVHDLKDIKPPFRYLAVDPEEISFIPLGKTRKMNLKEIIEKHPKGMEYSHLVTKYNKYPIILDKEDQVLSFPPIINGILTQVDENTKDLFLDITGYHLSNVTMALNILSTALHDQGGILEKVKVIYPKMKLITPDLISEKNTISSSNVIGTLGLNLNNKNIIDLLKKARFDGKIINAKSEEIEVQIPCYRFDIMHEADIIEEIAISYGYQNIVPTHNYSMTIGKPNWLNQILDKIRNTLIGLELLEVVNFTLTNPSDHFDKTMLKDEVVEILNPISSEYTITRNMVLPSLLKVFSINKHAPLPQKIFEIGDIISINKANLETKTKREVNIALAITDYKSDFTLIKTISNAFLKELGFDDVEYEEIYDPIFLEGRSANVIVEGVKIGKIGEINPQVLTNFELENPISAGEFYFDQIKNFII
jgi:phenylalanyl-tRNA synthetase beta chain